MPQTARGTVIARSGNQFVATFVLPENGLQVILQADCSSSVPRFTSTNVTLTYDGFEQLCSRRGFEAHIGEEKLEITTENGPVISGVLDTPLSDVFSVSGRGFWMSN